MVTTLSSYIEITPGVCGGKPRIAGHRIRVQDVAMWHERMGLSPDEIVSQYPGLTLASVYAALSYYHEHRDEIVRDMHEEEKLVESVRTMTPSKLLTKLVQRDAG